MTLYEILKHWDKLKVSQEEVNALRAAAIFIHNVKRIADRFSNRDMSFPYCIVPSNWDAYVNTDILNGALSMVQTPNGEHTTILTQKIKDSKDSLYRGINEYNGNCVDYILGADGIYNWILTTMIESGLVLKCDGNDMQDKLHVISESMARFIGRMNARVEGKNLLPVLGDSKSIKLSHYVAAIKNMFKLESLDLGTAIEAMTLSSHSETDITWTLYPNNKITEGYSACTYKSCMNNDNGNKGKDALKFYEALGDVELLTGSKGGKTHSRALLWKLPDGTYLMDRIYDYQEHIGMYEKMESLVKSKKPDSGRVKVYRYETGEELTIEITDMRKGKGQAENYGFVKDNEKVYISVQHLVSPLPLLDQCPYYDTVRGAKINKLYSKTITLMIGRDVSRVKELLFKNGGKKKYRDIHGYSRDFYPLWFFQNNTGKWVEDPSNLYLINNIISDITTNSIAIKNGIVCESDSSQDIELGYKSNWITEMIGSIKIKKYNGDALTEEQHSKFISKIKVLVDIDETIFCPAMKQQIHLSDACLLRQPMDDNPRKDVLNTILRVSGTPFKSLVSLNMKPHITGYSELCSLYRVQGNLASAIPVLVEDNMVLHTPQGNVLKGDFRLSDNDELIVNDLQFKAIGQ